MSTHSERKEWGEYFLQLTVIATAAIGGSFLFAPHAIPGIFSQDYVEPIARFYLQFLGATMFGYSIMNAYALNYYADKRLRLAITTVNICSLSMGLALSVYGAVTGVLSNLVWVFVAEHLIFLIGFILLFRATRK